MDTTNLESFERYWIVPRQFTDRKNLDSVTSDKVDENGRPLFDFYNSDFASTIDSTREYMFNTYAIGIGKEAHRNVLYSNIPFSHSQDNPLPKS
jgi:hypothetical protein